MRLWGGTGSHVGNVREVNQDRVYFRGSIVALADGMGGHQGGERAASIAIGEFRIVRAQLNQDELVDVVEEANRQVHHQAIDPNLRGMGTTMVALGLHDDESMTVVNVGDSRAYWLRGDFLAQITEDHSFVEDLVRQGRLSPEEAAVHPQRNILTRALGIGEDVLVDRFEVEPQVDDRFLLCSDGLFNEVSIEKITQLLLDNEDPAEAAQALVDAALATACRDNVTVAVANVVADDHPAVVDSADDLGIDLTPPEKITAQLPIVSKQVVKLDHGDGGDSSSGGRVDTLVAREEPAPTPAKDRPAVPAVPDLGDDLSVDSFPDEYPDEYGNGMAAAATITAVVGAGATRNFVADSTTPAERPVDDRGQDDHTGTKRSEPDLAVRYDKAPVAPQHRRLWPIGLLLALSGLIGAGYYGAERYNAGLYHVGQVEGELVIYRGREGGLPWLEPEELERTARQVDDLTEASQATVAGWTNFESLKEAQLSVDNLQNLQEAQTEEADAASSTDGG